MKSITAFFALLLLVLSTALVTSCGQDVAAPADESGTSLARTGDTGLAQTDDDDNGVRSPGYWKTHAAAWPVGQLAVGDFVYSKQNCLDMLALPPRGDHSVTLCRQLIAAKLNLAKGCDGSCVASDIAAADAWFTEFNRASAQVEVVPMSSRGRPLADVLDDYNNGLLCAPPELD